MAEHTHFIEALTFERLATEEITIHNFRELVRSMQFAGWNVFKMEETTNDDGVGGMTFYMRDSHDG